MQIIRRNLTPFVYILRESFVATLPYLLLTASGVLLLQCLNYHNPGLSHAHLELLLSSVILLQQLFPLLILVSVSLHFARYSHLNTLVTTSATLVSYLSVGMYCAYDSQNEFQLFEIPPVLALLCPLLTALLLKLSSRRQNQYLELSSDIAEIFHYIRPFFLTTCLSVVILISLDYVLLQPLLWLLHQLPDIPGLLAVSLRALSSHLLWFSGLHGDNTSDLLFNNQFLTQPLLNNLSHKSFYDLFVIFGGSGACMSLVIAILLTATDKHSRRIARLGLPFSVFNISEIIIYGLPIVFNRQLLLPFLAVPLLNIGIAGIFLSTGLISFTDTQVPWATPMLVNAWLATGGNLLALALQLILLVVGTLIYCPFVQRLSAIRDRPKSLSRLYKRLDISSEVENSERLSEYRQQTSYAEHHKNLYDSVELLQKNDLMLVYQPIINARTKRCQKMEALLRLQTVHDELLPPDFLHAIEKAGISSVIDYWVCQQIHRDITSSSGDIPQISINLHPDTLKDDLIVESISNLLHGMDVSFEIIERSFSGGAAVKANIARLRNAGFLISMDDFGTGYSGIASLSDSQVDIIKIDKSLIDQAASQKGLIILQHSCRMCLELGFDLVAEGVETSQQLAIAHSVGARQIQGWYYSKALPWQEAISYACQLNQANPSSQLCHSDSLPVFTNKRR